MRDVPDKVLRAIQKNFHAVIRERAGNLVEEHHLALPHLAPLPASDDPAWFDVPGMYGGFSYWLEGEGENVVLITESWCRVVDGSGRRHRITADGSELLEKGFV